MLRFQTSIVAIVLLWATSVCVSFASAQDSAKDQRIVDQVSKSITKAGKLFQEKKYPASAKLIKASEKRLLRLVSRSGDSELRAAIEKQHARLTTAGNLLKKAGVEIEAIAPLPKSTKVSPDTKALPDLNAVSFVNDVAPIIDAKCGRCHVQAARGQFSAKSFSDLMASTTVTPQLADESRFIEVIVSGEMPKGGFKVEAAELETLKKWIAQGAKFDGTDRTLPINESAPPAADAKTKAVAKKPTGNETVSFGEHVAAVFEENCRRCHMTQRPRGDFSMVNFQAFLRGGESGAPFVSGDSSASTLIKRLRGIDGDVMPPKGKLDDATIDAIAKWIDEGAAFDSADDRLTMAELAAKSRSANLSHDDLAVARKTESQRLWKLAMSDVTPVIVDSKNFHLKGTLEQPLMDQVSQITEGLVDPIQKSLGTSSKKHFVGGNATLFVLQRRYDFGEFGTMVAGQELPSAITAWWKHDVRTAWSSVYLKKEKTPKEIEATLASQLASLHVADISPSIPRWFAEGAGMTTAAKMFKKDPVVIAWEAASAKAVAEMKSPDAFLKNGLEPQKSALVSFSVVSRLRSKGSSFKRMTGLLLEGVNFDQAFAKAYGSSPQKFFTGK